MLASPDTTAPTLEGLANMEQCCILRAFRRVEPAELSHGLSLQAKDFGGNWGPRNAPRQGRAVRPPRAADLPFGGLVGGRSDGMGCEKHKEMTLPKHSFSHSMPPRSGTHQTAAVVFLPTCRVPPTCRVERSGQPREGADTAQKCARSSMVRAPITPKSGGHGRGMSASVEKSVGSRNAGRLPRPCCPRGVYRGWVGGRRKRMKNDLTKTKRFRIGHDTQPPTVFLAWHERGGKVLR